MAPSRQQPEANPVSRTRRKAELEARRSALPEPPVVRGELGQIRKRIVTFWTMLLNPKCLLG